MSTAIRIPLLFCPDLVLSHLCYAFYCHHLDGLSFFFFPLALFENMYIFLLFPLAYPLFCFPFSRKRAFLTLCLLPECLMSWMMYVGCTHCHLSTSPRSISLTVLVLYNSESKYPPSLLSSRVRLAMRLSQFSANQSKERFYDYEPLWV